MDNSLVRTFDVDHINGIINHEDVREGARVRDYTDFRGPILNDNNHCLFNSSGGFLFIQVEPGVYEVHTQFLKRARGPEVSVKAEEAVAYMFENTDCTEIRTQVYFNNPAPKRLAESVGFVGYRCEDEYELFKLPIETWARNLRGH